MGNSIQKENNLTNMEIWPATCERKEKYFLAGRVRLTPHGSNKGLIL